jgi:hypothetical protein
MSNAVVFNDLRRKTLKIDVFAARRGPTHSANAFHSTVALQFSPAAAKRLRELATSYADGSSSDLIRKALHLYDWCRMAQRKGALLLLKSADGRTHEVQLP